MPRDAPAAVRWLGGKAASTTLMPSPWRAAFSEPKFYKTPPCSRSPVLLMPAWITGTRRHSDGPRPHQQIGRHQRQAGRPDRRRRSVQPDIGRQARSRSWLRRRQDKSGRARSAALSNICSPVRRLPGLTISWSVMIKVCSRMTLTTSKCNRYTFRIAGYARRRRVVAFALIWSRSSALKGMHIIYADYVRGQSTRDAYAEEIKKQGGAVVGTTGDPARHRRHDAVHFEDQRRFRRPVRDFYCHRRRDARQPAL